MKRKGCHAACKFLFTCWLARAGLWAPPSRRAAGLSVRIATGPRLLPFTLLLPLLRSHWEIQRAGEPKASISKRVFRPDLHPPLLALTLEQLRFLPPLGEAAGNPDVALAAPETTSRCAGRPAGMGLTSSGTLVQESARKPREKQGCSGGKDQRPRNSKCSEGEFLAHVGYKVNCPAEVENKVQSHFKNNLETLASPEI